MGTGWVHCKTTWTCTPWRDYFLFGRPIFRSYVNFRGGYLFAGLRILILVFWSLGLSITQGSPRRHCRYGDVHGAHHCSRISAQSSSPFEGKCLRAKKAAKQMVWKTYFYLEKAGLQMLFLEDWCWEYISKYILSSGEYDLCTWHAKTDVRSTFPWNNRDDSRSKFLKWVWTFVRYSIAGQWFLNFTYNRTTEKYSQSFF